MGMVVRTMFTDLRVQGAVLDARSAVLKSTRGGNKDGQLNVHRAHAPPHQQATQFCKCHGKYMRMFKREKVSDCRRTYSTRVYPLADPLAHAQHHEIQRRC